MKDEQLEMLRNELELKKQLLQKIKETHQKNLMMEQQLSAREHHDIAETISPRPNPPLSFQEPRLGSETIEKGQVICNHNFAVSGSSKYAVEGLYAKQREALSKKNADRNSRDFQTLPQNAAGHVITITSTGNEDRVMVLPASKGHSPSSRGLPTGQHTAQQSLEELARRSHPLRTPSGTNSPGYISKRNEEPVSHHDHYGVRGYLSQGKHAHGPGEPVHHEVSSNKAGKQGQNTLSAIHEDSQYVHTSNQGSLIVEDENSNIVFNTKHIKADANSKKTRQNDVKGMCTISSRRSRYDNSDLSEPKIFMNEAKAEYMVQASGADRQLLIKRGGNGEGPRHHAGGSFGNLGELQTLQQADREFEDSKLGTTNSFVKLEQEIQEHGHFPEEPAPKHGFNRLLVPPSQPSSYRVAETLPTDRNVAENRLIFHQEDSSLEFQDRKYEIQMRQSSRGSRSHAKINSAVPKKGEAANTNQPSKKSRLTSRQKLHRKTYSNSIEDNSSRPGAGNRVKWSFHNRHHSDQKLTLSQSTEQCGENNSQISISQKSKDSYGKYFLKQRRLMMAQRAASQTEKSHDRIASKSSKSRGLNRSYFSGESQELRRRAVSSQSRKRSGKQTPGSKSPIEGGRSRQPREIRTIEGQGSRSRKSRVTAEIMNLSNKGKAAAREVSGINNSLSRSRSAHRVVGNSNAGHPGKQKGGRPPISSQYHTLCTSRDPMNTICQPHTSSGPQIKRAYASQKSLRQAPATSRQPTKSPSQSKKKASKVNVSEDHSLAHKLITDMAKKYQGMAKCRGLALQSPQHRNQMLSELQSLAASLLKAEKKLSKYKQEYRDREYRLKLVIGEQEETISLLDQKVSKLENRLHKQQRNEEKLMFEKEKEDHAQTQELRAAAKKVDDLKKKMAADKRKFVDEKKEIIINMERDHQSHASKLQKKADIKIQSLASLNDQLNLKLQDYQALLRNHEELQKEYNGSLTLINSQQETINRLEQLEHSLRNEISDLQLKVEHEAAMSQERQETHENEIKETESRWDQKLKQLTNAHKCELQKAKLAQDMNADSSKYDFEVRLNSYQMQIKQKDEALVEAQESLQSVLKKIDKQADEFKAKERELLQNKKDLEEQRESMQTEVNELQSNFNYQNLLIEKLQEEKLYIQQEKMNTGRSSSESRTTIIELQNMLKERDAKVRDLRQALLQKELDLQAKEEEMKEQVALLSEKIQLQQQEIYILAQGFQAQQIKLSNQQNKISGAETARQNQTNSQKRSSFVSSNEQVSQPGLRRHHSVVPSEQLINHQCMLNDQLPSESSSDRNFEEYHDGQYDANHLGQRLIREGIASGSSTERRLEEISATKKQELRGTIQTFGNRTDSGNLRITSEKGSMNASVKEQINQKDEEIKILWNVISQLKNGSTHLSDTTGIIQNSLKSDQRQVLPGHFTGKVSLNQLGSTDLANLSAGNQSSIMNINPTNHLNTGQNQSERNSAFTSSIATREADINARIIIPKPLNQEINLSSDGFASEPGMPSDTATLPVYQLSKGISYQTNGPQIVHEDQSVSDHSHRYDSNPKVNFGNRVNFSQKTFDNLKSNHSKELDDVKKRIQRLMGPSAASFQGPEKVPTQASFNESKESRMESESIEEFNFKKQRR